MLGAQRDLCCAGCEAVARTIVAAGFESYYETRTSPAAPPPQLPLAERDCIHEPGGGEAALILDRVRCAACLWLIEQALRRLPGVTRADVNYATQRAQVSWDPGRTRLARILDAVRAVGYDAYPYDPRRQAQAQTRERRSALWRLFVAAFGAMQVMMYAFPAYMEEGPLDPETSSLMRWASLLLTLPVVLFSCRPFFAGAWLELRNGRLGLDTPIALGIAGGFLASAWATIAGRGEVYFDSISMLAFLLLGARFVESAARARAARALDPLLSVAPLRATRIGDTGSEEIDARDLKAEDLVLVAPGERIPADGIVEQGVSSADEALLTGESRPIAKRARDALVGGSVNLEQPLVMRVTRAGADTRAAAIARLVERAAAFRPRLVEAADRVARVLTYVVLGAALIMYFRTRDLWIPVAILVATCPCALALAAPVVLTRAGAVLLGFGALLTRSSALESLSRVTDVVFDKTGTLTAGRFALARVLELGGLGRAACIGLAAALERTSRHPVAKVFAGQRGIEAQEVRNHPGEGVEGTIAGRRLRIGAERFCRALCAAPLPALKSRRSALQTRVFLADERGWLAAFDLEDALRAGARSTVRELEARGVTVHLCSGDVPDVASASAFQLGIDAFSGGMTPQDKLAYVERLQREGKVVAMVGDGLNDAPVLARADVSFAMSGGADAARLRADVILMNDSLEKILDTFYVARRAMRLVRQSLAWALGYNALALPLAAAGWIGPWEAALGMGASSLVVLLNSLRPVAQGRPWKASTSSFPSRSASYS